MMTPHRTMFWQINPVWIFYVLAVLAMALFLAGLAAHIMVWKKSGGTRDVGYSGDALKKMLLDVFLGRRLFKGHAAAGLMHLLIFWGFVILFIGTSVLAIHHYVTCFLEGMSHLAFSFCMELAGLMLLIGIIWALVRRYFQRVPRLERRLEDALVPLWLLLMVLSGFILEGLRLSARQPTWAAWSFVGAGLGGFFSPESAKAFYPACWWIHALLCLSFIALIPYTKLFHILGAPAGIYFRSAVEPVPLSMVEGAADLNLGDAIFLDGCMRCGRCVEACPSVGAGESFAPRDFVQAMRRDLWREHSFVGDIRFLNRNEEKQVDENLWYCTTCRACLEVCPVYGAAFEVVTKKRVLAVEEGTRVPKLLNQTLEKLFKYNNPWESSKKNRGAWADDLEIVDLTKRGATADLCYFVGCTTSFDDTAQRIAQSFSGVLEAAGVKFGILGKKEPCCGDIGRRVGELGLFEEQREGCEKLFEKYDITEIVTSSPHCFHTFKNEYPEAPFRAKHYIQLLHELLREGKLKLKSFDAKVTYHDPCYLGRHNRIFDPPRELIRAIPGLDLVEMPNHGENSLCCGGGGGRMWQDPAPGEMKMSEVRIREAHATGARILITACPLCLIMLEDARKAAGFDEPFKVMDLNELLLKSLEKKEVDDA